MLTPFSSAHSSTIAFNVAASIAVKNGVQEASLILLEPVMKVEVVTPEVYIGEVLADLKVRNAQVLGMDSTIGGQTLNAMVPLAEMFGYATSVRSFTQGRGTFTMEFDRYEPVPADVAERIVLGYQR